MVDAPHDSQVLPSPGSEFDDLQFDAESATGVLQERRVRGADAGVTDDQRLA